MSADADRIAQLRRDLRDASIHRDKLADKVIEVERERDGLRAGNNQLQVLIDFYKEASAGKKTACEERNAAQAKLASVESDRNEFREKAFTMAAKLAERLDDTLGLTEDSRPHLKERLASVEAEAAAMRLALEWALGHDECLRDESNGDPSEDGDSPMAAAMRAAIASDAGRALAARVVLLEAVVKHAEVLALLSEENGDVVNGFRTRECIQGIRTALAALDEKGGG